MAHNSRYGQEYFLTHSNIQWNLLIKVTQGTGKDGRYVQVGYNMGSLVGTY